MRARAVWVILTAPLAAAWTAGGGLARPCSRAAPRTCAPAAQAVDAGGTRANPNEAPAAPRFVWGATDVTDVGSSGPGDGSGLLVKLSAAYGWCLTPEEQAELDAYEAQLTNATTSYLEQDDLARLKLALEITYQSRRGARPRRCHPRAPAPPRGHASSPPRRTLSGTGRSSLGQIRASSMRWRWRSCSLTCAWRRDSRHAAPTPPAPRPHAPSQTRRRALHVAGERRLCCAARWRVRGHGDHALADLDAAGRDGRKRGLGRLEGLAPRESPPRRRQPRGDRRERRRDRAGDSRD